MLEGFLHFYILVFGWMEKIMEGHLFSKLSYFHYEVRVITEMEVELVKHKFPICQLIKKILKKVNNKLQINEYLL